MNKLVKEWHQEEHYFHKIYVALQSSNQRNTAHLIRVVEIHIFLPQDISINNESSSLTT